MYIYKLCRYTWELQVIAKEVKERNPSNSDLYKW